MPLFSRFAALYGHYKTTFALWEKEGISVPPVFIVVCNNTSTSKLVYDYISGFYRPAEDGKTPVHHAGRLELFRNYDEAGNRLARPRTLLIDSEQLESGEALDDDFREMASDEIERLRREMIERGDPEKARKITDQDLLREVMNTVGKEGKLGEPIRCVVSVSMLTEGWDANTVTHILGSYSANRSLVAVCAANPTTSTSMAFSPLSILTSSAFRSTLPPNRSSRRPSHRGPRFVSVPSARIAMRSKFVSLASKAIVSNCPMPVSPRASRKTPSWS
jgi:hypothetical protein